MSYTQIEEIDPMKEPMIVKRCARCKKLIAHIECYEDSDPNKPLCENCCDDEGLKEGP